MELGIHHLLPLFFRDGTVGMSRILNRTLT